MSVEAPRPGSVISVAAAAARLDDPATLFVDCRADIRDPSSGRRQYAAGHVPGALFVDLDAQLSGAIVKGRTGRHPLPEKGAIVSTLSSMGVGNDTRVIAYDASNGAMAAARLWWLLVWTGHDAVEVLDGGLAEWTAAGLPVRARRETRPPAPYHAFFRDEMIVDSSQVLSLVRDPGWRLLDARAEDRFHGKNETIDPVAGHIPGAVSAPYAASLDERGHFHDRAVLAARLGELYGGRDASRVAWYCGSGVSAAHGILASVHAGLGVPLLYPGSWSEWIIDRSRPVATD